MQNWRGQSIKEAKGGDPIQILGLSELPEAGRIVEIVKNEREAQQKVLDIQAQDTENKKTTLETFLMELKTWDTAELKLVLRSEGGSSLEALKQAIDAIQLPKNVWVKVISADVGQFTEWDLSLAQASKALLLGFDVPVPSIFKKRAEQHQVEVKSFDIIYELTDFLTLLLQGMIKKEYEEVLTGKFECIGSILQKRKRNDLVRKVYRMIYQKWCEAQNI
jgi:translation initiation factor IF-2